MDLQAPTPAAILAMRKLAIVRNYRPVVSDEMIEKSYGRHAADNPARSRNTFTA
jgi:hypothetical protein